MDVFDEECGEIMLKNEFESGHDEPNHLLLMKYTQLSLNGLCLVFILKYSIREIKQMK
jgi:hypothetical protein